MFILLVIKNKHYSTVIDSLQSLPEVTFVTQKLFVYVVTAETVYKPKSWSRPVVAKPVSEDLLSCRVHVQP